MSVFTNQTKHNSIFSNLSKNISAFTYKLKVGYGWFYNQFNYKYNQSIDPVNNNIVYYNTVGTTQSWNNQTKS